MKKLRILIILVIIVMIIGSTILYSFIKNNENNQGDYMDVYYYFSIEIEDDADYILYIPIPTNVDNDRNPNPLVEELKTNGNISITVKPVDAPIGASLALEINGSGNANIEFNKRFYQNTSEEKIKNRVYQITNLYLLTEGDTIYMYFNSSKEKTCEILFETNYINYQDHDDWQKYWKTNSKETLSIGWNIIELDEYHDGDV